MNIREEDCMSCGQCLELCPNEAIEVISGKGKSYGKSSVNHDKCTDCGTCVAELECPGDAFFI
jgi:ferredoxin